MKTKSARKLLVKKLDTAFSLYIRARDGRCVQCNTTENLTCGHLFSRVNHSTRWDEENCWTQCMGCNLRHEHEFEPFRRFVEGKLGRKRYNDLYHRHIAIAKYKDFQLKQMIEEYKKKLKQ